MRRALSCAWVRRFRVSPIARDFFDPLVSSVGDYLSLGT